MPQERNDTLSQPTNKGKSIWIAVDITSETMEARRKWLNIYHILKKKKNYQHKIQHQIGLSFRNEGKSDILRWKKSKRICYRKPSLKEELEEVV